MTVIVGVRYLVTSGGFALATRLRHPGLYRGLDPQIRREIAWSLASAAIYGLPAGMIAWGWQAHGWTRVYADVDAYPLWYLPLSVLAYLMLHDTWFYWTHRFMHRPRPFRIAHAVHHASRPPTAWAAMAFHPVGGAERGCCHSATGVRHSDPCRSAWGGVGGDDGYGGDQPHGMGDFPPVHVEGLSRALAYHRQPPPTSPRAVRMQLWPLFSLLGPALRHRRRNRRFCRGAGARAAPWRRCCWRK